MAQYDADPRFDPRIHSMTTLMVKERMARKGPGSDEYEVKQFVVGPAVPKETLRIQSSRNKASAAATDPRAKPRPGSAPKNTTIRHEASPPYLDNKGKWVPDKLPMHPLTNQSQSLSATTKLVDTTLPTKSGPRTIRPVAAVHSYLDNSPITTTEYVYGPFPDDQSFAPEPYHHGDGRAGGGSRPASAAPSGGGWGSRPATPGAGAGAYGAGGAGGYGYHQGSRPPTPGAPAPRTPEQLEAPTYMQRTATAAAGTGRGTQHRGRPTTSFPNAGVRQAARQAQAAARAASARRPDASMRASAPAHPGHRSPGAAAAAPQFLVQGATFASAHGRPGPGGVTGTGFSTMDAPLAVSGPREPVPSPAAYMWPRLSADDISRIAELGRHAVPGSAQTRLIGGKWRYVPRPVEGDVVFTDYYGPVGGGYTQNSFYGRSYNNAINMRELDQNRLVEDTAYHRVGASMAGITTLRTRPGYSLETKIIHAAQPEQLLEAVEKSPEALGLHHIKTYHRIKPSTVVA